MGVYAIGYLIMYFHLRTENQSLKSIMNATSQYMGVFDPEKVKGYVEIMGQKAEAERDMAIEQAITKVEEEAKEDSVYYMGVTIGLLQLLNRFSWLLIDTKLYEKAMREVKSKEAKRLYQKIVVEPTKAKWKERRIDRPGQEYILRWLSSSLEFGLPESKPEKKIK